MNLFIFVYVLLLLQITEEKKDEETENDEDEEEKLNQEWEKFNTEYPKPKLLQGSKDADERRKQMFYTNVRDIWKHNRRFEMGQEMYKQGINLFADKDIKALMKSVCSSDDEPELEGSTGESFETFYEKDNDKDIPENFDWRDQDGVINPPRYQGECKSCWAFSSTACMEAHYYIKTKKKLVLSPQQMVDCDKANNGCRGGNTFKAFKYAKNGIELDSDYPYDQETLECRYNKSNVALSSIGIVTLKSKDEDAMKSALYKEGPIDVGIYSTDALHKYESGVFHTADCKNYRTTHAVLAVGYGVTEGGTPYWIIKNSWGKKFGENGFFKIERGNNTCGIALRPRYVSLNTS